MFRNAILLFFLLGDALLNAQTTRVRGTVVDARTGDPLPFVNIVFSSDKTGTISDTSGIFVMQSGTASDSIITSAIGYRRQAIAIKPHVLQRIDIRLQPDDYSLQEIVIHPGRNPAFRILDLVIKNKKLNDRPAEHLSWQEYEKFQIYFGNYSERFIHRKQFNGYKFIFDYADSSSDGKPLLPIFMSEQLAYCSSTGDGHIRKQLFAEKRTGETYEQLTSMADRMTENVNIYSNFFVILDKSFIGPVNDNYQLYYKYYLEDSIVKAGHKYFRIRFVPKWKEDLAFSGEMLIDDTTFAVSNISLSINNEINLNYIRNFGVKQEFTFTQGQWLRSRMETTATICPVKRRQTEEFTVHRVTSDKDFIYSDTLPAKAASASFSRDESFWMAARPDSLNEKEKYSYMIADTLDYVPAIKKVKKAVIVFASGYLDIGKISIGQLHTFYSFNPIEQDRYKVGLRTNSKFSHDVQLDGYIAYGSSDKKIKYRAGVLWVPVKGDRRFSAGASYLSDLTQQGVSDDHLQLDNILTSLTRTAKQSSLTFNTQYTVFAEKSWNKNLVNRITLRNRKLQPLGDLAFDRLVNPEGNVVMHLKEIISSEIILETRLAFGEKALESDFKKTYMPSAYPAINLQLAAGFSGILNSGYDYQRVTLSLNGKLRLNPLGYTLYHAEAGKVFGNVPYLLTEIHPGNQTLVLDREGFNLMKYFEFASDEYISLLLDHHFEGFILNKIPLIKKAELREVVSARAVAGNLHQNTRNEMILPAGMKNLDTPYVECSVGLENIFKIVRIDYIWRVTEKSPVSTDNWSIKAKLYFTF